MNRILIIDDDPVLTMLLSGILRKSGYDVITANDGTSGLRQVEIKQPDLVITDYQMPDFTGLEVLGEIMKKRPTLPVIVLTAHGDVSLTIKAIQNGAFDYIEKPIDPREILEAIRNGLQAAERSRDITEAMSPLVRKSLEENLLVSKDPVMRDIFKNIGRISMNKVNVLLLGEVGTGKERVARLIHYSGISRDHPFQVINCGATSEEEMRKDLFGVSDARMKTGVRAGKLDKAGMGTVFLDEVSHLSPGLQSMLLELLRRQADDIHGLQGEAGNKQPFEARIIASSSFDIETLIQKGLFIKDLYYQINEFALMIPPLRERKGDIAELINHMIPQLNRSLNKKVNKIQSGVIEILQEYHWPGNIRELKNVVTQAMIMSHCGVIERKNIIIPKAEKKQEEVQGRVASLEEVEKEHIKKVLSITSWNKQEASILLGISRPTLNTKIEKYNITKDGAPLSA